MKTTEAFAFYPSVVLRSPTTFIFHSTRSCLFSTFCLPWSESIWFTNLWQDRQMAKGFFLTANKRSIAIAKDMRKTVNAFKSLQILLIGTLISVHTRKSQTNDRTRSASGYYSEMCLELCLMRERRFFLKSLSNFSFLCKI